MVIRSMSFGSYPAPVYPERPHRLVSPTGVQPVVMLSEPPGQPPVSQTCPLRNTMMRSMGSVLIWTAARMAARISGVKRGHYGSMQQLDPTPRKMVFLGEVVL